MEIFLLFKKGYNYLNWSWSWKLLNRFKLVNELNKSLLVYV